VDRAIDGGGIVGSRWSQWTAMATEDEGEK